MNFLLFYIFFYAGNAVQTFVPVYLNSIKLSQTTIGVLLAIGPFVALFAQPLWGIACDRAKTKNTILKILLLGGSCTFILYPLSRSYYYIFMIMFLFTLFYTSIAAISDTITLEYLESTSWSFGKIRMGGTFGYAIMSLVAGVIVKHNIKYTFILYPVIILIAFLIVFNFPEISGYQSKHKKISILKLFENRKLVTLMIFVTILHITLGFYYSFFAIYFKQLGGDSRLLGLSMFISAICELPFLLFADKIIKKLGIIQTLAISGFVMGIRWLLLYIITNIYIVTFVNVLHGFSFIVLTYCMAVYINNEVPKELKASGQALNGLMCIGLSRVIGSIFGGYLSDVFGIRPVFLFTSIVNFVVVIAFVILFRFKYSKWETSSLT